MGWEPWGRKTPRSPPRTCKLAGERRGEQHSPGQEDHGAPQGRHTSAQTRPLPGRLMICGAVRGQGAGPGHPEEA